jgi:hypothetical protein
MRNSSLYLASNSSAETQSKPPRVSLFCFFIFSICISNMSQPTCHFSSYSIPPLSTPIGLFFSPKSLSLDVPYGAPPPPSRLRMAGANVGKIQDVSRQLRPRGALLGLRPRRIGRCTHGRLVQQCLGTRLLSGARSQQCPVVHGKIRRSRAPAPPGGRFDLAPRFGEEAAGELHLGTPLSSAACIVYLKG